MSDNTTKLFLFATIRPKPEHFDEARAALDAIIPPTLEEPGCHIFAAFISATEDHTLHLFECFDDEAALTQHYEFDYTKQVFKKYESWLRASVDIKKLTATAPVSADQFHD